jgi:uncharacterized glyoxalase superfamily protein PhnB
VAPWIISKNTAAELAFLAAVFGASEKPGSRIMDGNRINHVEIDLAGAVVLLFDSFPDWAPTPAHMRVYVADVERTLADARARGARVVTEPVQLAFGDIVARFRDPQGHLWWIHQHVEDVAVDELGRRFGEDRYVQAMNYVGRTLREEMTRQH